MPYLLGLWGEIQPAQSIFPVGIPPTMSQPSFSVFNFSFLGKKKKERSGCPSNEWSPMCPCVYLQELREVNSPAEARLWVQHSTALAGSWIKMGQSNILQQIFSLLGSGRFWNLPIVAVTQGSSLKQFSGEQLHEWRQKIANSICQSLCQHLPF